MKRSMLLAFLGVFCAVSLGVFPADSYARKPAHPKKAAAASREEPDEEGRAERSAPKKGGDESPCTAEILMDSATGEVLFEKNSHEMLRPASMVKMMTAYVTAKKIKDGAVSPDDIVTASARAAKMGGSQVYLKEKEQFPLSKLLEALMIQSANDAAMAIAEHVGGSAEGFVDMMNETAQDLGMKETEYHSPHGLPPSPGDKPDLISAHDAAILGQAIVRDHPELLELSSRAVGDFRDGTFVMNNHNHLITSYPGCDGIKTGFYAEAGFCVTATAKRNNLRMIAVVMGCNDRHKRDAEASRLMTMGFSQYRNTRLIEKGGSFNQPVTVSGGKRSQVVPVAAQEARGQVKSGDEKKIERKLALCGPLQAPVAPNTPCGSVSFLLNGKEVGRVDAVIPEGVEAGGMTDKIKGWFGMQ